MPKVKTLLVILLVITFSFSLLGCGLITSRTASTDEVVETGGQVPEWLLLSHRSIASEENDLDAIDENDEADEAVGGVDEDDGVTAESGQTEQATSEVAQAAETGSSGNTQQQAPSSSNDKAKDDTPKPGTREYNAWFAANRARGEYDPIYYRWYTQTNGGSIPFEKWKELQEEKDSNDSIDTDWFDGSPSGWGS